MLGILLLLLLLFYYKRNVRIYYTTDIFILFYFTVIISTVLYHYYVPNYLKFNLYNFDKITNKRFLMTLDVFVKMMIFFLIGTFTFKIFNNRKKSPKILTIKEKKKIKINYSLLSNILLMVLSLNLILVFLDYGFELFYRTKYLPDKSSTFKTIYQVFFVLISFLAGFLFKKNKFISFASILLTLLIGLSMGSRFASVYLIIFSGTYVFTINSYKKRFLFLFFFIPFIVVFFGFNISLRSETKVHGLFPYAKILYEKPYVIYEYTLKNIYYSLVFGFYATADTIKSYTFSSTNNLITCLSPLPGRMTNWYIIADKMRSNEFAPFTAIGELSKYKFFFFFYYYILGYYFSFIDASVKKNFALKKYALPIIQILLIVMFVVFSFEYNLRSANRYIYYSMILFLLSYISKNIFYSKKRNSENDA